MDRENMSMTPVMDEMRMKGMHTPQISPVSSPSKSPMMPITPLMSDRVCEKCKLRHSGTYGPGRFCSANCAKKVGASHRWNTETFTKKSTKAKSTTNEEAIVNRGFHNACEHCGKLHDGSYGSGRFCSVHCARRVAASRKWEKQRDAKRRAESKSPPSSRQRAQQMPMHLSHAYATYRPLHEGGNMQPEYVEPNHLLSPPRPQGPEVEVRPSSFGEEPKAEPSRVTLNRNALVDCAGHHPTT